MTFQQDAKAAYVNGQPVDKSSIRTLWAAVDGVVTEVRNGRVWHTSSDNLATQTPPEGTDQISIARPDGQIFYQRLTSAPATVDPAIHSQTADGLWWRLSEDSRAIKGAIAAETAARTAGDNELRADLRSGRVWFTTAASLSGSSPVPGADLAFTSGGGVVKAWLPVAAPDPAVETEDFTLDANGQWWSLRFSGAVAKQALADARQALAETGRNTADIGNLLRFVDGDDLLCAALRLAGNTRRGDDIVVLRNRDGVPLMGLLEGGYFVAAGWQGPLRITSDGTVVSGTGGDLLTLFPGGILGGRFRATGDTRRGDDVIGFASRDDIPLLGFSGGQAILDPHQSTVDLIAARLGLDLETILPAVDLEEIGLDLDGWGGLRSGDVVSFTARIWGGETRSYLTRTDGDSLQRVWADGPGLARCLLGYGGEERRRTMAGGALHKHHVLTLGDPQGAAGLNGQPQTVEPTDFDVPALTLDAAVADSILADRRAEARSLPWHVVRSEARGAAGIADLAKGGQAYANLRAAWEEASETAALYKRDAEVFAVSIMHGPQDMGAIAAAAYKTRLLGLVDDIITDLSAAGYRMQPRFAIWQCNGTQSSGASEPGLAHFDLAVNSQGRPLVVVGPRYPFGIEEFSAHIPNDAAMRAMADLEAEALVEAERGNRWYCPLALSASHSAGVIEVTFDSLTDLELTGTVHNEGFEVAGATITGVALKAGDPRTVKITLSAPLSAAATLSYARQSAPATATTLAAQGGVREVWTKPGRTGPDPIRRYALAFELTVGA